VKRSILGDARLMLKARMQEEEGNTPPSQVFHRLFLGNPGTGKTTLPRQHAKLLFALGCISDADEAFAMAFGLDIQRAMEKLKLSPNVVADFLNRGMLPPEIEREFSSKGMTRSDNCQSDGTSQSDDSKKRGASSTLDSAPYVGELIAL
jgi:hypothetical protein